MNNYFIPKLHPSQVVTAGEYLVAHGQIILPMMEESLKESDYLLDSTERVKFALYASFSVEEKSQPGVIMVTTHNFFCCSSVGHNLISVQMPYTECIGIGDAKGLLTKKLPIHCGNVAVEVSSAPEKIGQLTEALLNAILAAPSQHPLAYPGNSGITRRSAEQYKSVEKIKKAHRNERRLSKAELAIYGECPSCGGDALIAKARKLGGEHIFCSKCGADLGKAKK